MNKSLQKIRATFELELDVSFPFPSTGVIFLILFLIAIGSILIEGCFIAIVIAPHPPGVIPLDFDYIVWAQQNADFNLLAGPLFNLILFIIIVIPMLSAFKVAGPIEAGLLKTLLTYPIRRRNLLVLKVVEMLILTVLPITIGVLMGVVLIQWVSIGLTSLVLLLSFWVMTFTILLTSVFLSLVTQSMTKSAFGGIAIWVVLYLVAAVTYIPNVIRGALNPVNLVLSYFNDTPGAAVFGVPFRDPVVHDVWGAIIINLVIGIIMLLLSVRQFRRVEV
jgi:ABC-type transport system involved in multi-copper enzyme maturation permease subunit